MMRQLAIAIHVGSIQSDSRVIGRRNLTSLTRIVPSDVKEFPGLVPERILTMTQERHTVDQMISKLGQGDVQLRKGKKAPEVCKAMEIT